MPYISSKDDRREKLRNGESALTAGELNYQIFYYVKYYSGTPLENVLKTRIKVFIANFLGSKPNYQKYNDMTGCLIRCARELKRRLDFNASATILMEILDSYDDEIAKYEDKKIKENGDVE